MNMLGLGNMQGFDYMTGGNNVISQLFCGTNSIFNFGFNPFGGSYINNDCGIFMNCNGEYNYDAMAGFAVGNVLLNVALGAIGYAIENKNEDSVENRQAEVKDCQDKLDEKLKELGVKTVEEADSYNIDEDKTIKDANTKISKHNADINKNSDAIDTHDESLKTLRKQLDEETDATKKSAIQENITKVQKLIDELEADNEELQSKIDAQNEIIENRQDEIEEMQKEIKDAQAELVKAQEKANEAVLDEADGTALGRISQKKYMAKFTNDENGKLTDTFASDAEFSKRDLKRALSNFSSCEDEKQKEVYKKQFIAIYDKLAKEDPDEIKNFKEAYKLIKGETK